MSVPLRSRTKASLEANRETMRLWRMRKRLGEDAAYEAMAERPFVHRVVPATDAPRIETAAVRSVWELAA